jgi:ketosteroid isomerase-like protein
MNSRSPEQVLPLFGENGTYEAPGTNGPVSGQILAWYLSADLKASKGLRFFPRTVIAEGDRLSIEWHARQERTGGPVVTSEGVTVIEVADNHIRRARTYVELTTAQPGPR